MTQTLLLYAVTAIVFLGIDMIGIQVMIRPVFEHHIGHLLVSPLRIGAAIAFYLFYVAGILWFVSLPALRESAPLDALIGGMILGFLCYGTYEMTNYATLAAWSPEQVIIDGLWGTLLTGFAAWAGVAALCGRLA